MYVLQLKYNTIRALHTNCLLLITDNTKNFQNSCDVFLSTYHLQLV